MTKLQSPNNHQSPIINNQAFYWLLFGYCYLVFGIFTYVYALNLDNVQSAFINGDYKAAITEGEKVLAEAKKDYNLDELYCFLGLSYLKDDNLLRASDIFEIIINEFEESRFRHEAELGLADTYFLRGLYEQAIVRYNAMLREDENSCLRPLVYSRLSQCAARTGNSQLLREYQDKLKQEFPLSIEPVELLEPSGRYYSVQVGAFSNLSNANNLQQKLVNSGYSAFVEEVDSSARITYKVKVGKFQMRSDAEALQAKLSNEGYPTKIPP